MSHRTEQDFLNATTAALVKYDLTRSQRWTVESYCQENGEDCGDRKWDVAISTLEDLIDQGELLNVAHNGERGGPFTMNRPLRTYIA